ncbi:MAG: endonuclease/exonuclease/phosphatase family protein [Flavobacteriaceae bacterium]|nr:endonuclease/exonuclease/phosphatase family protein [Flavobacteriaceae bacterium]
MKNLNLLNKFIFLINSVLALLLLLSFGLSYVPPKSYALISTLSLSVPLLIILNLIFTVYWLIKLKKQVMLSLLVLVVGYNQVLSFYKFSSESVSKSENSFSIMSYNVRLFNLYNWIDDESIPAKIQEFIEVESPNILCFQENDSGSNLDFKSYAYKYQTNASNTNKSELAILSTYKILNSGFIDFPNSANSAIFADVLIKSDTMRIYNVHLQSTGIDANMDVESLDSEQSNKLLNRLGTTFKAQQYQAELVAKHVSKSPHKVLICGDFNNTIYSYVYRILKGDLMDAFETSGTGFGSTFDFKYFPVRIDFILADQSFLSRNFKNYTIPYSDHFPILSEFSLHK